MLTKTYRAKTFAEAIEKIRSEMGSKASIVSTKRVPASKSLFRNEPARIEVTAQIDDTKISQREIEVIKGKSAAPKANEPVFQKLFEPVQTAAKSGKNEFMFKNKNELDNIILPAMMDRQQQNPLKEENEKLKQQIEDLRNSLSQLKTENHDFMARFVKTHPEVDENRRAIKNLLESKGIYRDLVEKWLDHSMILPDDSEFDDLLDDCVDFFMAQMTVCSQDLPPILSFCGPAGSGKTTMVMKLAKALQSQGKSVAIVSMDTGVGNVEMYRLFALKTLIPVNFATANHGLPETVIETRGVNHILIDTQSFAPNHQDEARQLCADLNSVGSSNYLVFSAKDIDPEFFLKSLSDIDFSGLMFSKLDETSSPGPVLNLCDQTGLPMLYFGIGKTIDEDFEKASVERIVAMIFNIQNEEQSRQTVTKERSEQAHH